MAAEVTARIGPRRMAAVLLQRDLAFVAYVWVCLVVTLAGLAVAARSLELGSFWAYVGSVPQVFLFVLGILMSGSNLRVHIAHGYTRRDFNAGGLLYGLGMVAVVTLLHSAGFALERALFAVVGWEQFPQAADPLADVASTGTMTAEFALLNVFYYMAGWVVGSGFYRFHWLIGLIIIVPVSAAHMLVNYLRGDAVAVAPADAPSGVSDTGTLIALWPLTAIVAFTLVAVAANWLMLREAPIKPMKSV